MRLTFESADSVDSPPTVGEHQSVGVSESNRRRKTEEFSPVLLLLCLPEIGHLILSSPAVRLRFKPLDSLLLSPLTQRIKSPAFLDL